jgi:hypothetical protein
MVGDAHRGENNGCNERDRSKDRSTFAHLQDPVFAKKSDNRHGKRD